MKIGNSGACQSMMRAPDLVVTIFFSLPMISTKSHLSVWLLLNSAVKAHRVDGWAVLSGNQDAELSKHFHTLVAPCGDDLLAYFLYSAQHVFEGCHSFHVTAQSDYECGPYSMLNDRRRRHAPPLSSFFNQNCFESFQRMPCWSLPPPVLI